MSRIRKSLLLFSTVLAIAESLEDSCTCDERNRTDDIMYSLDRIRRNNNYIQRLVHIGDVTIVIKSAEEVVQDAERLGRLMGRDDVDRNYHFQQLQKRVHDRNVDLASIQSDIYRVLELVETSIDREEYAFANARLKTLTKSLRAVLKHNNQTDSSLQSSNQTVQVTTNDLTTASTQRLIKPLLKNVMMFMKMLEDALRNHVFNNMKEQAKRKLTSIKTKQDIRRAIVFIRRIQAFALKEKTRIEAVNKGINTLSSKKATSRQKIKDLGRDFRVGKDTALMYTKLVTVSNRTHGRSEAQLIIEEELEVLIIDLLLVLKRNQVKAQMLRNQKESAEKVEKRAVRKKRLYAPILMKNASVLLKRLGKESKITPLYVFSNRLQKIAESRHPKERVKRGLLVLGEAMAYYRYRNGDAGSLDENIVFLKTCRDTVDEKIEFEQYCPSDFRELNDSLEVVLPSVLVSSRRLATRAYLRGYTDYNNKLFDVFGKYQDSNEYDVLLDCLKGISSAISKLFEDNKRL